MCRHTGIAWQSQVPLTAEQEAEARRRAEIAMQQGNSLAAMQVQLPSVQLPHFQALTLRQQ